MKNIPIYKLSTSILTILLLAAQVAFAKNKAETPPEDREELNYGYGILYKLINDVKGAETLMAIKENSESTSKIAEEITKTLKDAKETLNDLQKKYPALEFGDNGQPDIVNEKNKMLKHEKTFEYMPFFGKTGVEFERNFLISSKFTLDQVSKLAHILSDREKSPGIKKPLQNIADQTKKIMDDIEYLLNERYYKDNLNKAAKKK